MTEGSAIVRARNEERHRPTLIERLSQQSGSAAETIVVDSQQSRKTILGRPVVAGEGRYRRSGWR